MVIHRFDVYLVYLDPSKGREMKKTRPCLVVSPDEINHYLGTAIVAPMTTQGGPSPYRIPCQFRGKTGKIVLDQLRTVDRIRLVKKLGHLDNKTSLEVLQVLQEMFAP